MNKDYSFLDSIIFDLDGTLWDSVDGTVVSWNRVLEARGMEPFLNRGNLECQMGKLLPDIGADLFRDLSKEELLQLIDACVRCENEYLAKHGGKLYPGVPEVLEELSKNFPLSIVSNCEAGYIESFFEAHKLGHLFTDYENPGRTGLPKAENLKIIAARNDWKRPVYIGDTPTDYKSAQEAGMPFIHAAYGFGEVPDAPVSLRRFSDLPELLIELAKPALKG